MALLHINKVHSNRTAFSEKVKSISQKLGIDPNWLMHVMYIESGLDEKAVNSLTSATGLIQFMPDTARRELGTTVAALRNMSNVEQLDYVYRYLKKYKSKYKSYVDLYFAVFFPIAIGKGKKWVLETSHISPQKIARQNWTYDLNRDGRISVGELEKAVLKKIPKSYIDSFKKKQVLTITGLILFALIAATLIYMYLPQSRTARVIDTGIKKTRRIFL